MPEYIRCQKCGEWEREDLGNYFRERHTHIISDFLCRKCSVEKAPNVIRIKCEYCSSISDPGSKKCSACGAPFKFVSGGA